MALSSTNERAKWPSPTVGPASTMKAARIMALYAVAAPLPCGPPWIAAIRRRFKHHPACDIRRVAGSLGRGGGLCYGGADFRVRETDMATDKSAYSLKPHPKFGFLQVAPTPSPEEISRFYAEEFYSSAYQGFNNSALEVLTRDQEFHVAH